MEIDEPAPFWVFAVAITQQLSERAGAVAAVACINDGQPQLGLLAEWGEPFPQVVADALVVFPLRGVSVRQEDDAVAVLAHHTQLHPWLQRAAQRDNDGAVDLGVQHLADLGQDVRVVLELARGDYPRTLVLLQQVEGGSDWGHVQHLVGDRLRLHRVAQFDLDLVGGQIAEVGRGVEADGNRFHVIADVDAGRDDVRVKVKEHAASCPCGRVP